MMQNILIALLILITAWLMYYQWESFEEFLMKCLYLCIVSIGIIIGVFYNIKNSKIYEIRVPDPPKNLVLQQLLQENIKEHKNIYKKQKNKKSQNLISKEADNVISEIIDLIIRDFLIWWYRDLVKDPALFIQLLKSEIWKMLFNLKDKLEKMDAVKFFTSDAVERINAHLQSIRFASNGPPSERTPYTLSSYLSSEKDELEYLRQISDFFLLTILPEEYSRCKPLRKLLREIVSNFVFHKLIDLICDPDYINQKIIAYLKWQQKEMEHLKRTYIYSQSFEDFIKMLNNMTNVDDLKRIRSYIVTEIIQATTISNLKRAKGIEVDKEFIPQTTTKGDLLHARNLPRYLNQLRYAKSLCEKHIKALGGPDYTDGDRRGAASPPQEKIVARGRKVLALPVILESSHCRKYLSKYLLKDESHSLLGFWEAVEEMKQADKIVWHQLGNEIFQTYINNPSSCIKLSKHILKGIESFMMANKGPESFYEAQDEVYNILEERFYRSFIVSDVYHKMITEAEINGIDFTHISDSTCEPPKRSPSPDLTPESSELEQFALCDHSGHARLQLQHLETKLMNKTQALQALRGNHKSDPKMISVLEQEIDEMKTEQDLLKDHIFKTECWIKYLGQWEAYISEYEIIKENDKQVPYFNVMVEVNPAIQEMSSIKNVGWVVTRNITAFHHLHQRLLPACPGLKKIELPSQTKPLFKGFDENYLLKSKRCLQNFLEVVVKDEELNKSEALYSFLSPSPDHLKCPLSPVKRASKFTIIQFIKRLPLLPPEGNVEEELLYLDDMDNKEDKRDSIAEPLYALIGEIFELKGVFNWLRRTLIIVVQATYENTINRQLRESVSWITSEPMLLYYLQLFRDSMWPNGILAEPLPVRDDVQKIETRKKAKRKVLDNIPEILSDLVGQQNARKGVAKVFDALQNKQLNKQLLLDILEVFIYGYEPELKNWDKKLFNQDSQLFM